MLHVLQIDNVMQHPGYHATLYALELIVQLHGIPDYITRLADYDCIVRAEKEVVLATNYWQPSNSVNTISSALMKLSKLVGDEERGRIVVKIMWDRGSFSQFIDNHPFVTPEGMEALDLPRPDEIPNIDLQVIVSSAMSCTGLTSTDR